MDKSKLADMLALQDVLNREINPNWMRAGYPWLRAIHVECVEAMDHLGWKWWAKHEPNLAQAKMEMIDIWHFLLSWTLVWANGDIERAADELHLHTSLPRYPAERSLVDMLEDFGSRAVQRNYPDMILFARICETMGLSNDELYCLYLGKAALNRFRQLHGYAFGTYQKMWNGTEDNVMLERILNAMPDPTSSKVMAALERAYACLTSSAPSA